MKKHKMTWPMLRYRSATIKRGRFASVRSRNRRLRWLMPVQNRTMKRKKPYSIFNRRRFNFWPSWASWSKDAGFHRRLARFRRWRLDPLGRVEYPVSMFEVFHVKHR